MSSVHKNLEDTYERLDEIEHIMCRPDTFVGSCTSIVRKVPTFSIHNGLQFKDAPFVEGLVGIFDEILVNAADHKTRNPKSMTYLKVAIQDGKISVKNNGPGLPVQIHKVHNEWLPEMIFGSLRTSSNYKDTGKKRLTGGRNGFGAKLTNIFSKNFRVMTTDGITKKKFSMTWRDHMSNKSKPSVKDLAKPTPSTTIEFEPDMTLFKGISLLEEVQDVLCKRVLDVAGTCAGLNVTLNGEKLPVKGFRQYCTYFAKSMGITTPVSYIRTNGRWEIAMCASPNGEAKDVSFVNHISTDDGGTHVRSVRLAIESELLQRMEKKFKTSIPLSKIRNNLLIFVSAMVENPSFGSQTKVKLTTQSNKFGMRHGLASKHFNKLFRESNIMDIIETRAKGGLAGKAPSTTKSRVIHEKGLKDANWAGTRKSLQCRLILTEGDSAATLATSGREKAGGPNINGIYPLRGKLFNPCSSAKRDAQFGIVKDKKELNAIVRILNLKNNLDYTVAANFQTLRYGKLVIMVDQDKDGAHIGGLIMNFLKWWNPSILRVKGFLYQFITPVMKATKGKSSNSFFSINEYKSWAARHDPAKFSIKYYKGLGTSTAKEAKQYFSDLSTHLLPFETLTPKASSMIDVAFSGQKRHARKEWIAQHGGKNMLVPDFVSRPRTFEGFLNSSLMEYNVSTFDRAIPSVVDGLKVVQRKVLFATTKRNLTKDTKVAQVASMVSEVAMYHHGETSMMSTIIGMAQTFVGKNNINLLTPQGQFGTRLQGGDDAASPRYIFTNLSPLARKIFMKEDDDVLEYLEDEGQTIEPHAFAPILPMVLVNGANGIATGWSTTLPMFNPVQIIDHIIGDLTMGSASVELTPWYRGFTGTIEKDVDAYVTKGKWEFGNNYKVRITELPIGTWTEPYIEKMLKMGTKTTSKSKANALRNVIVKHADNSSDVRVDIVFTLSASAYQKYSTNEEAFVKDFYLSSTLSMNNIHLLDAQGMIKKYPDVESIIKEFTQVRLQKYEQRKAYMLKTLAQTLDELTNKIRFINHVVDGSIPIRKVTHQATIEAMLKCKVRQVYHDRFLALPISSLNVERIMQLEKQIQRLTREVKLLKSMTPSQLWIRDLKELKKALLPRKRKHTIIPNNAKVICIE